MEQENRPEDSSNEENKRDNYEILGVPKDASEDDIKVAFARLKLTYGPHRNPDNPDAKERLREIMGAYQALMAELEHDPKTISKKYDKEFNAIEEEIKEHKELT